jgi:hypothetical protein
MGEEGYTPAQLDTQLAPYQALLLTGGPWAIAAGHKLDASRAALDAYAAGPKTAAARANARAAMQGWVVAVVEEPAQKWIDAIGTIVRTDETKPAGKVHRTHDPSKETTRLKLTPLPAGLQLPPGTLHVEARVVQSQAWLAAQKKAKKPVTDPVIPHTTHLLVVPDGARTWLALAEDPALAAAQVRSSLSSAPDAGTLKARADLDALRVEPASVGGYLSVASLAMLLASDSSDEGLRKARDMLQGLASLTGGGQTPVPLTLTIAPRAGGPASGGDLRMHVVLPLKIPLEIAASPHSIF